MPLSDILRTAYLKFKEKLSVCRDILHGYDYSGLFGGNELTAGRAIMGAANFLMDIKKKKKSVRLSCYAATYVYETFQ